MGNRRANMQRPTFGGRGDNVTLEQVDAQLFGDLDRAGKPTRLALIDIRLDGGTQPRESLNPDVMADYADAILDGATFPPVDVFYDGTDYWLADGFHRWWAHDKAGLTEIEATIHQGDQRDAVLFSAGVNADHGLRRTNADKRRAVVRLLNDSEWRGWSDHKIARTCKVSQPFVSKLRAELSDGQGAQTSRKVTRGGKTFTMDTSQIGGQGGRPAADPAPSPAEGVAGETPAATWTREDIEQAILTVLGYADSVAQDYLFGALAESQVPGPYPPIMADLEGRGVIRRVGNHSWALVTSPPAPLSRQAGEGEQGAPEPVTDRERALAAQHQVGALIDAVATAAANLNAFEGDALADLEDDERETIQNWLGLLNNAILTLDDDLVYLRGCVDETPV